MYSGIDFGVFMHKTVDLLEEAVHLKEMRFRRKDSLVEGVGFQALLRTDLIRPEVFEGGLKEGRRQMDCRKQPGTNFS